MRLLALSKHFQKQFKKLSLQDKEKVVSCLKAFLAALKRGQIPLGFGFKKLNGDKYELRVDIRTRIVLKSEGCRRSLKRGQRLSCGSGKDF